MGNKYTKVLVQAMREGKHIRVVGDNLNFSVGQKYETQSSNKHLKDMFVSTALVSDQRFLNLCNEPQIELSDLTLDNVLLSQNEYDVLRNEIKNIAIKIAMEHIPQLKFMKLALPEQKHTKTQKNSDNTASVSSI